MIGGRAVESRAFGVAAAGVVRASPEELAGLRHAPGPGVAIPRALMKHADDHTVLGLAAVVRAIGAAGWSGRDLSGWSVIAAPRFPGRLAIAPAFAKFRRRGAAGVSPLIIPCLSLHSAAGSISLALGMQGRSFGVGGGLGHLGEALLAALAMHEEGAGGTWVVASAWSPEPVPDEAGASRHPTVGTAVALGLAGADAAGSRWALRVAPGAATGDGEEDPLIGLAGFLEGRSGRVWRRPVGGGMVIEVEDRAARAQGAA